METPTPILFFFSFFFFFFPYTVFSGISTGNCETSSCSTTAPPVHFPFGLSNRQAEGQYCSYPGFDLSCNNLNHTVLTLPLTGEVAVKRIDYADQILLIDPGFCSPGRIFDFSLKGTPFENDFLRDYTFFNCSNQDSDFMYPPSLAFQCLSGENYTVIAIPEMFSSSRQFPAPATCRNISTISLPARRYMNLAREIALAWYSPNCRYCEIQGQTCGFTGDENFTMASDVGCSGPPSSRRLPRSVKYGLIIGIGIPGLVCLIGLVCYIGTKVKGYNHDPDPNIDLLSITITPQPPLTGLDGPTIESYPKIVLGDSRRLPKPGDDTCPICLSDYQPKEAIRTIPECNHCFHADCIDEWLRLNATCPVCRNSPDNSSLITPCTSISSATTALTASP